MNLKRIVPNTITCCNLLCGSVSIYMATQGAMVAAFSLIIAGAVFDFFDGMSARLLKAPSPIGIELDSLADDITFGLAPAMMLMCYLRPILGWWSLLALLMAAFSALRLARFNLDERQHTGFIGLATPANALFWGGLSCMPYAMLTYDWMAWMLLGMSLVSCWLMNSEIPFFSFKSVKDNKTVIIGFAAGAVVLIGFCVAKAIASHHLEFALFAGTAVIIWYVALNLLLYFVQKK